MQTFARFQLLPLLLLITCAATAAHAQGVIIDQSLQPPAIIPGKSYHYDASDATLIPETGQEFTPSLNGVDFVNVNLVAPFGTNTGIFQIALHEGSITAPLLGLSDEVIRSSGAGGNNTHFTFPGTVALTRGDTYVLEILQISGNSGWAVEIPGSAVVDRQTFDMNYPGGRLIYGGAPQAAEDLIFQEGIFVPEPSAPALCLLACMAVGYLRKSSSRRICV